MNLGDIGLIHLHVIFDRSKRVDHPALFNKAGKLRGDTPIGAGNKGMTVEDELVVGANGIAIDHRNLGLVGDAGNHRAALDGLAEVEGRSGQVE